MDGQRAEGQVLQKPPTNGSKAVSSIVFPNTKMDEKSEAQSNYVGARAPAAVSRPRPRDQLSVMEGFGSNKTEPLPTSEAKEAFTPASSLPKPLYAKTRAMDMWGTGYGMN
eukprot:m.128103 g.128103  ORF g.128103 m.128103 type:complete len:111 (-) comp13619_c0_seq3:1412-1744(-)